MISYMLNGKARIILLTVGLIKNTQLKNATGVDTKKFDKNADLAISKSNADKLDIDKLKSVPVNSNNLKN